jgi:pyridoxal phosphate enzyme (YggS family)
LAVRFCGMTARLAGQVAIANPHWLAAAGTRATKPLTSQSVRARNLCSAHAKIRAMSPTSGALTDNLARVRERIAVAASRAGRRAEEITLVAVSKTHSARKIQELYEAGERHFGENRMQERESKLAHLAGLDATWHMIGHLQKNKAARAARLFDSIDSVDSVALAEKLNRAREEFDEEKINTGAESIQSAIGKRLRVLIEVKLDPEPAKSGIDGKDLPRLVEAIARMPHLDLCGLMGVPPYFDDPEEVRPFFRRLRELRDSVRAQMGAEMLPVLSMGMSQDLEIAIEEGATEVRVGTALFGERERA